MFNADPNVGGRYSALTAFGLVPSGLAGVDIEALLDEAEDAAEILAEDDEDNIGLALGAALGGTVPLRDKIVIRRRGLRDCRASPTGPNSSSPNPPASRQTGVLPVVVEDRRPGDHSAARPTSCMVRLVADTGLLADADIDANAASVAVSGALGAQMMLWEYATAVAGRLLGINPFDQPDVEAAKVAARGLLDATPEPVPRSCSPTAPSRSAPPRACSTVPSTRWPARCAALLGALPRDGYLSDPGLPGPPGGRRAGGICVRCWPTTTGRPVTFGWGPRFLHSTGQFHKGGPRVGVYLQVTAESAMDLSIPERPSPSVS